jgi:DNA-directed RNA polymerase specialized sigma24 family protein
MTIERDDPEVQTRGDASERALRAKDRRLCKWAIRRTAAQLIDIPPAVVETIVYDAYLQYERFRASVRNPRALLVKRILARAEAYRESRDLPPSGQPHPPVPPDLLDLIHMQTGAADMTENTRKALALLFDGNKRTYDEIALELDVTVEYVEKAVRNGVALIRKWAAQRWPEMPW